MKPNFEEMTNRELREYALSHREEIEPLRILFNRRSPDSEATLFYPPQTPEEERRQFELFKQIIEEKETRNS